jgi:hypothetical protein
MSVTGQVPDQGAEISHRIVDLPRRREPVATVGLPGAGGTSAETNRTGVADRWELG